MKFSFNNKTIDIQRFPKTKNATLRPWNASDELIVKHLSTRDLSTAKLLIYNDTFGFLSIWFHEYQPVNVVNLKSGKDAIRYNEQRNKRSQGTVLYPLQLKQNTKFDVALVKLPKSIDLFELFLREIHENISDRGEVLCGFMTKYFTKQWLAVAQKYFETIEQTKAEKKARLLILKNKKKIVESVQPIVQLEYKGLIFKQFYGVFSGKHIDYATQFLLEHTELKETEKKILDLASGNGVIARVLLEKYPHINVQLLDDSFLAIESSKMNLAPYKATFIHHYNLEPIAPESLDTVISNPPFHFEYEKDISVPLSMFAQVYQRLKKGGRFIMVANRNLSYKKFLQKIFNNVEIKAENTKFILYECKKIKKNK